MGTGCQLRVVLYRSPLGWGEVAAKQFIGMSISFSRSERKTKFPAVSEYIDGVIRRELVSREYARRPEQPAAAAHPCSGDRANQSFRRPVCSEN